MTQSPGWRADSSGQRHERYFDPASGLIQSGCGECAESYGDPGADAVAQRSRGWFDLRWAAGLRTDGAEGVPRFTS